MASNERKVAVIAIAKDEGPYIHEWIHHYLYFGFSDVFIAVNRTTDSTMDVLDAIKKKYNQVHFCNVDWMDKGCPGENNLHLQVLSYAYIINEINEKKTHITDVLIVDIDEFWFPGNFHASISDYLLRKPAYDLISFNWLGQMGDTEAFSMPFENLNVIPKILLKTLLSIKATSTVKKYRVHSPIMNRDVIHLDANGHVFQEGNHDQIFKEIPAKDSEAFILHRMVRSESEYLALLLRKNPDDNLKIKKNRSGFGLGGALIDIDSDKLKKYHQSLQNFINENNLTEIIKLSRQLIIENSKKILDIKRSDLIDNLAIYMKVLKGTALENTIIDKICSDKVTRDEFYKIETQGKVIKNKPFYLKLMTRVRSNEI